MAPVSSTGGRDVPLLAAPVEVIAGRLGARAMVRCDLAPPRRPSEPRCEGVVVPFTVRYCAFLI